MRDEWTGMRVFGETPCIYVYNNNNEIDKPIRVYKASLYAATDWLYHQKTPPRALFYLYIFIIYNM